MSHQWGLQDDDFPPRDDFSDADQLRVGNDGIFMLAFFSEFFFSILKLLLFWLALSPFLSAWNCILPCITQLCTLLARGKHYKWKISCLVWRIMELARLLVAFLFNWIGFCLSFCLTNTIAGRYGAICGFGLSLIKWILIVRVSFF